tara:strand:- start:207 stop:494 length:288 start_codon:yes stop_codon:yes gene_type:complete
MTNRVTEKQLEYKVKLINEITNSPLEPYTKNDEGKYKSNIGNYHLSHAYGGVQLHKMCNDGGGISTPLNTGYTTKKELYVALNSFLIGLEIKKVA